MVSSTVKEKLRVSNIRVTVRNGGLASVLVLLALLTFICSWAGVFPPVLVENWYAHGIFPIISYSFGLLADMVPFAWLDTALLAGIPFAGWTVYRRKYRLLSGVVAGAYLVFFWSWGLNYHRPALSARLNVEVSDAVEAPVEAFRNTAAGEINRLYRELANSEYDDQQVRSAAADRVGRVVEVIHGSGWGSGWPAARIVKTSRLANAWFQMAGVDGLFNPFSHEPIISNGLLEIERPFVIAHELAHVRGYPNEGDANFVAVLATLVSGDPRLQYSGWLNLWFYLRNRDADALIDEGPRQDMLRIAERRRSQQVRWVSSLQTAVLDWYLKANNVDEGIRSYSQVVLLAVATERQWERFR